VGIAANRNVENLAQIAHEFGVKNVGVFDTQSLSGKRELFPVGTNFFCGEQGLCELASLDVADSLLMAISGTTGLRPTLAAIENKKTILVASKEILVVAGRFVTECARKNGVRLLPVDSEHNAIFQCLAGNDMASVESIILTSSGGQFRNFSRNELDKVTLTEALNHPIWQMGPKITIDSATMANKALEIVEAMWLFDVSEKQIDVLIHPEGIIHSMVKFCDGSIISQMCPPNMEYPIANCLFFPKRQPVAVKGIDFVKQQQLTFAAPDVNRFPNLFTIRQCLQAGGNACAVFQGANEAAVEMFLSQQTTFARIEEIVERTLDIYLGEKDSSLEGCINSTQRAYKIAKSIALKHAKTD
jgi:1-deoxy-D-xylulose-5-phosphate reductoisomerase